MFFQYQPDECCRQTADQQQQNHSPILAQELPDSLPIEDENGQQGPHVQDDIDGQFLRNGVAELVAQCGPDRNMARRADRQELGNALYDRQDNDFKPDH
jgi:hypothetical protein